MEMFGLVNGTNPYTAAGGVYDYDTGINGEHLASL